MSSPEAEESYRTVASLTRSSPADGELQQKRRLVETTVGRALLSEILTDEGHSVELAENAAQARAASVAVGLRAPMLTAVPGGEAALTDEVGRLGAERVLRVGTVTFTPDDGEVVDAPAGRAELEELTGITFDSELPLPADRVDEVAVHQVPGRPSLMVVGEFTAGGDAGAASEPFAAADPDNARARAETARTVSASSPVSNASA